MVTCPPSKGCNTFDLPDMSFSKTSVLVRAINFEDVHQVRFLLKKGSDPNKPVGEKEVRPLMVACLVKSGARKLAIFRSLFRYEVNPELADVYGQNSLMYTCAKNLKDELQVVLDHYVCSFYNADIHGNTLLHICAKYSSVEVMDMVLKKMFQYSMNINVRNKNNHTPLDEAILQNNISCVEKLYKVGGQRTLPEDKKRVCFSSQLKMKYSSCRRRTLSLPIPLNAPSKTRKLIKRVKTQVELPPVSATKEISFTEDSTSNNDPSSSTQSKNYSVTKVTSGLVPLKDSEEILHQILDLKSRRTSSLYCRPADQRVPLDDKWVSTTRGHLRAISDMQEWAKQNAMQDLKTGKMTLQNLVTLQAKSPTKLWNKVLLAANRHRMQEKAPPEHNKK